MNFNQQNDYYNQEEQITISRSEYTRLLNLMPENTKLKEDVDFLTSRFLAYSAIGSVLFSFALLGMCLMRELPQIKIHYLFILILVGSFIGKPALILVTSALTSISKTFKSKIPYSIILLSVIGCVVALFVSGRYSANEKLEEKRQSMLEEVVYITTSGTKYHTEDCYLIDANFTQAIGLGTVIGDGFIPCSACNPTTEEDIENALSTPDDVKKLKTEIETLKTENSMLNDDLSYLETSWREFKDTKGHFVDEGIYYHNRVCIVDLLNPDGYYHKYNSNCSIQAPYIMTIELAESSEINKTYCTKCYGNDDVFLSHKFAENNTTN